jgi:hypothetical protein
LIHPFLSSIFYRLSNVVHDALFAGLINEKEPVHEPSAEVKDASGVSANEFFKQIYIIHILSLRLFARLSK